MAWPRAVVLRPDPGPRNSAFEQTWRWPRLSLQRRAFLAALVSPNVAELARAAQQPVILRAWLGMANRRHGHDALGAGGYPGSLHALVAYEGQVREVRLDLPADAAFEDGLLRRVNLDGRDSDEIVLVLANRRAGAAIAVYGVQLSGTVPVLSERARSPAVGPGRWQNPVGVGDFNGDGRLEVVSVLTPHIGGVLTLYGYKPPDLLPLARTGDVCNHVYGRQEQRLAAVLHRQGRTVVAIPDQSRYRLRTLSVASNGQWASVAADVVFSHPIDRVMPTLAGELEVLAGPERRLLP